MRFLIDNQLPRALAEWIRTQGHEAEHVLEVDLAQARDNPIWHYAHEHAQVIVSKDEDFAEWVRRGRPGPQVLWLRLGNTSTRILLNWLSPLFAAALKQLDAGARLVEVR